MKTIGTIIAILLFATLAAAGGYAVFTGCRYLSSQWAVLHDEWRAGLAIFASVLAFCTLVLSASVKQFSLRDGLASAGKASAYNAFVEWYSALKKYERHEQKTSFTEIRNQMILWGSDRVVKQVHGLYEHLRHEKEDREQVLSKADLVYLEIRRELGHRSMGVDRSIV